MGELNCFMRRIKKVDEFVELFFPMGPYHKDILLLFRHLCNATILEV